jgi:hypothetical protein
MTIEHKQLAGGRWKELSFIEQMANIGSEVERTIRWKEKGNLDYSRRAFERALELLDLTMGDGKNKNRLREIVRVREALADYFAFENFYLSTDEKWKNYFLSFNFASRANQ